MDIVIAGGHGQIAMLLHPLLAARGHAVRALIRNPDHAEAVRAAGAEPAACDLEQADVADLAEAIGRADAVVFAAGAGPNSGPERKWTMDRDGAVKLMDAAKRKGVQRYLMISAIKAEIPRGGETFQVYLRAKAEADAALRASGLDWTILRPGKLTDEPGKGRVALAPELERSEIPRADVAAVLAALIETPEAIGKQFDLVSGETPIDEAVRQAVAR